MATILLDDGTAGRTYVAKFVRDSDGYIWDGVSAWVAPTSLTDAELKTAIELVTLSAVTNESSTHVAYMLTVPAGITVPCHISVYLTSYAAGDEEDYGYDYDPQVGQILEDTGTTVPALIDAVPTAAEIKTAMEAGGGHLALILEDTGTTLPATLTTISGYVDCLPESWVTVPTAAQIRTEVLTKGAANDEDAAEEDSLITLILAAFHSSVVSTTWTINQTDDATEHASKTVTADAGADPITGVN